MRRLMKLLVPALLAMLILALLMARPGQPERIPRQTFIASGIAFVDGRAKIDLNRADAALLTAIPGIGPALAARIEAYVQEKGALKAPEELLEVDGIGPAKLRAIKEMAVVAP